MENVITRIVEIEKKCAEAMEKAEAESRETVKAYSLMLEERKKKEFEAIMSDESARFSQSVEGKKKSTETEAKILTTAIEMLLKDRDLQKEIKDKIINMLLSV